MSDLSETRAITLKRSLGIGTLLAIAISCISPTTAVFVAFGTMLETVGTGVALAFLIGGVLAVINSLVYAELGTVFPLSGGAYAIVLRVFGKPFGLIVAFLYLLMGLGSIPTIALATAGYLHILTPGVSVSILAAIIIILATLIAILKVHSASWITAAMVILEFLIIISVTILCFAHAVRPIGLGFVTRSVSSKGIGSIIGAVALITALPITLFSFSGYELSQNFSEEAINVRRVLSRTIIISAVIGVVIETLAVLALTLATKNFGAALSASMPPYEIVKQAVGNTLAVILLVGVIIATFDCTVAVNMSYIRVFYNAARDGMFTSRLSKWLQTVSSTTRVPTRVAIVWAVLVLCVALIGTLGTVLAFTGVVLVLIYGIVAFAALFSRRKFAQAIAFKMPLWPAPAVVMLACMIYLLFLQSRNYLLITAGVAVLAALYYLIVVRRQLQEEDIINPDEEAGTVLSDGEQGMFRC